MAATIFNISPFDFNNKKKDKSQKITERIMPEKIKCGSQTEFSSLQPALYAGNGKSIGEEPPITPIVIDKINELIKTIMIVKTAGKIYFFIP